MATTSGKDPRQAIHLHPRAIRPDNVVCIHRLEHGVQIYPEPGLSNGVIRSGLLEEARYVPMSDAMIMLLQRQFRARLEEKSLDLGYDAPDRGDSAQTNMAVAGRGDRRHWQATENRA